MHPRVVQTKILAAFASATPVICRWISKITRNHSLSTRGDWNRCLLTMCILPVFWFTLLIPSSQLVKVGHETMQEQGWQLHSTFSEREIRNRGYLVCVFAVLAVWSRIRYDWRQGSNIDNYATSQPREIHFAFSTMNWQGGWFASGSNGHFFFSSLALAWLQSSYGRFPAFVNKM